MSAISPIDPPQNDNPVRQFAIGMRANQVAHARELAATRYEGNLSMAVRYLLDLGMAADAAQTPTKT